MDSNEARHSTAHYFLEGLNEIGCEYLFCNFGTDHAPLIEVMAAFKRTGRKARALEIDPRYVDVAVKRWQTYTGKAAVLAATGSTFEEISEKHTGNRAAAVAAPGGCNAEHAR